LQWNHLFPLFFDKLICKLMRRFRKIGFSGTVFFFVLGNIFLAILEVGKMSNLTVAGQSLIRAKTMAKIEIQKLQVPYTKFYKFLLIFFVWKTHKILFIILLFIFGDNLNFTCIIKKLFFFRRWIISMQCLILNGIDVIVWQTRFQFVKTFHY